jgi:hypothetical protein
MYKFQVPVNKVLLFLVWSKRNRAEPGRIRQAHRPERRGRLCLDMKSDSNRCLYPSYVACIVEEGVIPGLRGEDHQGGSDVPSPLDLVSGKDAIENMSELRGVKLGFLFLLFFPSSLRSRDRPPATKHSPRKT